MYYCYDQNKSDLRFVIQRMKVIPENLRREVSARYELLVKPNDGYSGRRAANEYLDEFASKYKSEVKRLDIKLKKPPARRVKPGKREYNSIDGLWSKQPD